MKDKSILITGGTGSLGQALTKHILSTFPDIKRLVIFSRDEQKQFEMEQQFPVQKHPQLRYFIGDVRDSERLERALSGIDYVIHAAAMKHVHIAEYNPDECIKTNIGGAENVIKAALKTQVQRVVALSTDKACAPINLYGATKLTSDKLFVAANNIRGKRDVRFSVVRYGNVMGSNGSVIPFFLKKKKTDGILPITVENMTRFNISLQGGVDMVMHALETAWGGEIFVPKIPSYHILDVAEAIGPECEKPVIGIRPGEKIHEEMISSSDSFFTYDLGKYYAIVPQTPLWNSAEFISNFKAVKVPEGFSYASNTNDKWETIESLRELIKEFVDPGIYYMMKSIPYGRQEITQDDIDAVVNALQSDFLTQGPKIAEFEQAFAKYVDAKYAIAISNGTAALHLSVMACEIKEDEYVICSPITFSASVNCVKYCGGQVLFADIDPETYLMDLESVKQVINNNPDKKIRGIIPVDFAGRVPQLDALKELADEHGLWVIEDACHSPGGFFVDRNGAHQLAGNGKFAQLSVFSFHPVKHIATGEGGMITTNDENLYKRLQTLRTHGITRDSDSFQNSIEFAVGNSSDKESYPLWYMEMQELGYNYRLTDFQAALGISQLKRADRNLEKRRAIAARYAKAFDHIPSVFHQSGLIEGHAYHLFILEVSDRKGLYDFLRTKGIFAQIHYIPVHLMPYYKKQGWKEGDCPHAENYYSRCISIPMFPTLTDEEVEFVINTITNFYSLKK